MVKCFLILLLPFLLSSCFNYSKANKLYVWGNLDGAKKYLNNFVLEYYINGKRFNVDADYRDWNFDWNENGNLKVYGQGFCNVLFSASDYWGCGNTLSGKVVIAIYLKDIETGNRILLSEKNIDMDTYFRSVLLTQVFWGADKDRYVTRSDFNIDWKIAKPLALNGTNDTIYHYTAWYWDKRGSYEDDFPDEKYFIEIP